MLAHPLRQKPCIAPLMPVASQAPNACLPWLLLVGALGCRCSHGLGDLKERPACAPRGVKGLILQVPAADYGLNILDILRAPEKELNQVIGLKRLAPYRDDGGRFRPNMAKLKDMQVHALLQLFTLPDCYLSGICYAPHPELGTGNNHIY